MAKKNQLTTADYLPYDEYKRLLDCLHNDGLYEWELYALVSFCTACRVSDVVRFKWKDIIGMEKVTVTEKKTGKTRAIPLNDSVQEKIMELYKLMDRPGLEWYVFGNKREGVPVCREYINRKLKEFKERYSLRIGNFSTHTFRKTFGRYFYEMKKESPEAIFLLSLVFKHSSPAITQRYIGVTKDEISSVFSSIAL